MTCKDPNCLVGRTENGGNCRINAITYQIICKDCKDTYSGETSRNGHSRSIEHVTDAESNNEEEREKSVLLRHMKEKHNGDKVDFDMKVIKSYQHDPLARQCAEAVLIKNVKPEKRINNKTEYHQPGDVEARYEKGENREVQRRKRIMEEKNEIVSKKANVNGNYFKCPECDYKASVKADLVSHKKSVHQNEQYSCEKCDYKVSRNDRLISHTKSVHEQSKFQCEQCEYKTSRRDHLKSHIISLHDKNQTSIANFLKDIRLETEIQENTNDLIISTQEMIEDARERRQHKVGEFFCDQCGYKSTSKTLLNKTQKQTTMVKKMKLK